MRATPARAVRRIPPEPSDMSTVRNLARLRAASSRSGRPRRQAPWASAASASPFQLAITLSSRAGCGRAMRASSNRAAIRSMPSGASPDGRSTLVPCSKLPVSVTP